LGRGRGALTLQHIRKKIICLIEEACIAGARQEAACSLLGISSRTLQRWVKDENQQDGRILKKTSPSNKLSDEEEKELLQEINKSEYANLTPHQIVPLLADQGRYIASESTMYRILKKVGQLKHRMRSAPRKHSKPRALKAVKPNQLYSWDITYLPTLIKGNYFYLYLILDVFSRKIVGWQVYDRESAEYASDLLKETCSREKISQGQVTLHSDNGKPMKGASMIATLQQLGVIPSFSRPSVSDDNPYSEALFKTVKYVPFYPDKPFASLSEARRWVDDFVHWYNEKHLHSAIGFATPSARHNGEDEGILERRQEVYQQAKKRSPKRWSRGERNWKKITEVFLNPEKCKNTKDQLRAVI
jgi:transposase InsO family protein